MNCTHTKKSGEPCTMKALDGRDHCQFHARQAPIETGESMREIDPEVAAMQKHAPLVSPSPKAVAARNAPNPDPELAAMLAVMEKEKQDAKDRANGRVKPAAGTPPLQVAPRRRRTTPYVDQTAWAKQHIKPGNVGRWVRTVNRDEKQTAQRTDQFYQDGYDFVRNSDNEVITGPLGVLMEGPAEAYVDRVRLYEKPYTKNPDSILDGSREAVNDINRLAGEKVCTLEKGAEHGSKAITEEIEL